MFHSLFITDMSEELPKLKNLDLLKVDGPKNLSKSCKVFYKMLNLTLKLKDLMSKNYN